MHNLPPSLKDAVTARQAFLAKQALENTYKDPETKAAELSDLKKRQIAISTIRGLISDTVIYLNSEGIEPNYTQKEIVGYTRKLPFHSAKPVFTDRSLWLMRYDVHGDFIETVGYNSSAGTSHFPQYLGIDDSNGIHMKHHTLSGPESRILDDTGLLYGPEAWRHANRSLSFGKNLAFSGPPTINEELIASWEQCLAIGIVNLATKQ